MNSVEKTDKVHQPIQNEPTSCNTRYLFIIPIFLGLACFAIATIAALGSLNSNLLPHFLSKIITTIGNSGCLAISFAGGFVGMGIIATSIYGLLTEDSKKSCRVEFMKLLCRAKDPVDNPPIPKEE